MGKQKRRKGKIKFKQSVRLASIKNNAGIAGHPPALNNAANIRVSIKHKA